MKDRHRVLLSPWVCIGLFALMLYFVTPPRWETPRAEPRFGTPAPSARARPDQDTSYKAADASAPAVAAPQLATPKPRYGSLILGNPQRMGRAGTVDVDPPVAEISLPGSTAEAFPPGAEASPEAAFPVAATSLEPEDQPLADASAEAATANDETIAADAPQTEPATTEGGPRLAAVPVRPPVVDPDPTTQIEQVADEPASHEDFLPQALIQQLRVLAERPACAKWAQTLQAQVARVANPELAAAERQQALGIIRQTIAKTEFVKAANPQETTQWKRAQFAIQRRLPVWDRAVTLAPPATRGGRVAKEAFHVKSSLALATTIIDQSRYAEMWRDYLMLDALQALAENEQPSEDDRETARKVLARLRLEDLSPKQQRFLGRAELQSLASALLPLAHQPAFDEWRLLASLEQFERDSHPTIGRQLANSALRLAGSDDPQLRRISSQLEQQYRGCNVRFSVSRELLNRLLPPRDPMNEPVRTTILGLPVYGHSTTQTSLGIQLVPDKQRARLLLQAQGVVDASTTARSGPVDVFNQSQAHFQAQKPLEIGAFGLRSDATQVEVQSNSRLNGIRTDYDGVPLLGSLVRNRARDEHAQRQWEAKRESESQVSERARQQVDAACEQQLASANQRLQQRIIGPMERLALNPRSMLCETTTERLVIRTRLASNEQLAAYTPRPRASSQALASLQFHQSAVTNLVEQLELGQKAYTLPELVAHFQKSLGMTDRKLEIEAPDHLRFRFADRDGLVVLCREGLIEAELNLSWLELAGKRWHDVQVRVAYRPEVQGQKLLLSREGALQLSAERLNTRSQFMLRGLFSRVFPVEHEFRPLGEAFAKNPQLQQAYLGHVVVDDGWLSVELLAPPVSTAAKAKEHGGLIRRWR